eukprot:129681-Amphidinium_carterae.1
MATCVGPLQRPHEQSHQSSDQRDLPTSVHGFRAREQHRLCTTTGCCSDETVQVSHEAPCHRDTYGRYGWRK